MSVEHITAVMDLHVGKSSLKFLLMVLANMASPVNGEFYPSVKYLEDKTELNRKTILAGLKELQEMGLIEDTGKREGETRQVVVYRFTLNSTEIGTVQELKQSQKVTETVPIFPANSTVFSAKESQKRDTETKGNKKETKGNKREAETRIPEDWKPDDEDIGYILSRRPDLNVSDVAERFKNYWLAKAGKDAKKRDWHATWRTWVLNERQAPKKQDTWGTYFTRRTVNEPIDITDTLQLG